MKLLSFNKLHEIMNWRYKMKLFQVEILRGVLVYPPTVHIILCLHHCARIRVITTLRFEATHDAMRVTHSQIFKNNMYLNINYY